MMKDLDYQDIGLFTFYRQQAEQQERQEAEKKEMQLRKKLKKEEQERKRKQKQQLKLQGRKSPPMQPIKYICSSPVVTIPKEDYTQKAKQYIKQLQSSGHNKFIHEHKKKLKRYKNSPELKANDPLDKSVELSIDKKMESLLQKSQEIFVNKKDYNSKLCYYQLMSKQTIVPKQFDSVQVFAIDNMAQMKKRQQSQDLLKRKNLKLEMKQKIIIDKLPKISTEGPLSSGRPTVRIKKKQKRLIYYNPLDIILNNEKFKLKPISNAKHQQKNQPQANTDMVDRQNFVQSVIKKCRLIK